MAPAHFNLYVLFIFIFDLAYRPVRKYGRLQQAPVGPVHSHELDELALIVAAPPPVLPLQPRRLLQQRPAVVALLGRFVLQLCCHPLPVDFPLARALHQLLELLFFCVGPFHLEWWDTHAPKWLFTRTVPYRLMCVIIIISANYQEYSCE